MYKEIYLFEKQFLKKHGITINEDIILCFLKDGIPKPANNLCQFIGLPNFCVSRIISIVENKQVINREMNNKDKQQMIFSISEKGQEKNKSHPITKLEFRRINIKNKKLNLKRFNHIFANNKYI